LSVLFFEVVAAFELNYPFVYPSMNANNPALSLFQPHADAW